MNEGYVKFSAKLSEAELPEYPGWQYLNEVRTELHDLELIGIYPNGIGYGNVSIRIGESHAFLITGTATGAKRALELRDYCRVDEVDIERNQVLCTGRVPASSESMSHAAVYRANPEVGCVIHVHSADMFGFMLERDYPATAPEAEFGTREMAREIQELVAGAPACEGIFVMAGHEDGIIAYGRTTAMAHRKILQFECFKRG